MLSNYNQSYIVCWLNNNDINQQKSEVVFKIFLKIQQNYFITFFYSRFSK